MLLRVAQEAFHNVTKHAGASQVTVTADTVMGAGSEYLDLVISDDGVGFDPTASYPGHLGLRSMYERVTGLEGRLEINSAPGAGTTVRVRAPLKAQQGEARA